MCRYVDDDIVLGNLFIKVIEKEIDEITFNKIYDFIYYTSLKLNEVENTLLLVSRDKIIDFAERYREFIQVDESGETIMIRNREKSIKCFKKLYQESGEEYAAAFDYAMDRLAA